jgi:HSP20 family molecular chaperone IbpA
VQIHRPYGVGWDGGKIDISIAKGQWRPYADVYETHELLYVTLEIAGADLENIEIIVYEDALVVKGKRNLPPYPTKGKYHVAEIQQGDFCFELPLSVSVRQDQVEFDYNQGLLLIFIKKS